MTEDVTIWRELHALQTAMCFPLELPAYYASPTWLGADTVLDVGSGHGDYLLALARRFPEKTYLGVDIEPAYVDAASVMGGDRARVRFAVGDVMALESPSDFAVVRLLLQHLDDVPGALRSLAQAVRPGGSALVIDALDAFRAFHPPLPAFADFFGCYRRMEQAAGRNRDVMDRLPQLARDVGGWTVGAAWNVLVPATFPGQLEIFRAVYSRVIDLFTPIVGHACDMEAVRTEWTHWCANDLAYAQVGLRLVRLDRR